MAPRAGLSKVFTKGDSRPSKLEISSVDMDVRPGCLTQIEKRAVQHTQAIMLHFIQKPDFGLAKSRLQAHSLRTFEEAS
ncbi:hypothetical protein BO996_09260 [Delftia sp. HK171]|jgi:hypothetical protein|nr:hypothetical protein BO996_09260 [Delftia sp. HK171]